MNRSGQSTAHHRHVGAEQGYDPAYGARPLRRLVQREIGDRLATALLSGDVRDGDAVTVDLGEAGLLLR